MYGIIPRANTEALANAPPVKALSNPNNPESVFEAKAPS